MKAKADCIACMFKQALNTARVVTDDPQVHTDVLRRLAACLVDADLEHSPAFVSQDVYRIVTDMTGVKDPYEEHKRQSNAIALRILPDLREAVMTSDDPLGAAIHLAATGNTIDAGIGHATTMQIEHDILELLDQPFAVFDVDDFRAELGPRKRLLYLGDNAGEIVFDTVLADLVRRTGTEVVYCVKSGPIINDATIEDAETAVMPDFARIIETGSNDIGVNFERASREFLDAFADADLILGKGHGNFETCNDRPENIYFLLKAKCPMVAAELGVELGDLVFKHSRATGSRAGGNG